MRLKTLTVSGFRGFAEEETIDLDAEAIIVVGANGSGKTSMFDAILWALTGSVGRLHGEAADVVSKYSPTGEARVVLEVRRDQSTTRIIRRFDDRDHLTVEDDEEGSTSDDAARASLIDLLWPDGKSASDPNAALSRTLTRAMISNRMSFENLWTQTTNRRVSTLSASWWEWEESPSYSGPWKVVGRVGPRRRTG
jgi:ATPase subunit of ABC transporter with duplicated ATPase domains